VIDPRDICPIQSSGSKLIPRRARPDLAGLRPHSGANLRGETRPTNEERDATLLNLGGYHVPCSTLLAPATQLIRPSAGWRSAACFMQHVASGSLIIRAGSNSQQMLSSHRVSETCAAGTRNTTFSRRSTQLKSRAGRYVTGRTVGASA